MEKIISTEGLPCVADSTKIARYFNHEKTDLLLKENNIWFTNASKFSDTHEREIPKAFFKNWPKQSAEAYKQYKDAKDAVVSAYISCWTMFDAENYALWKIYDEDSRGICIVTTVGELKKQLRRKDIIVCATKYIDPNDTGAPIDLPWVNYEDGSIPNSMRVSEQYKILPYKYEQEIRVIIYERNSSCGFGVDVDLQKLVNEIYLNPFMKTDDAKILKRLLLKTFNEKRFKESIISEN